MTDAFAPAGPDRWTIRLARRYPHPVEKVWRAVSRSEHLSAWFPATVDLTAEVGATVRFGAPMDGEPELTGVVTDCEPPHLLAFTWDTDHLRFELHEVEGGTEVVLLHAFDDRSGAASFAAGWGECFLGLAAGLDGAPPPASTRAERRHEELVAAFGLDAPAVDEVAPDGSWRIVFERQLVAPVDDLPSEVEVVPGTGHGPRLRVTVTGTDADERASARARWHDRLEAIAAAALASAVAAPSD